MQVDAEETVKALKRAQEEKEMQRTVRELLARLLGQPGYDFSALNSLKRKWEPTKAILRNECQRRKHLLGNDLTAPCPNSQSSVQDHVQWLKENRITDKTEIQTLLSQFCRRMPLEIRALMPAPERNQNVHVGGNDQDEEGSEQETETEVNGVHLDAATIMARALGLAGCDYRNHPFKNNRLYTPTKPTLFAECMRRKSMMGLQVNRQNRWQVPTTGWTVHNLTYWLRKHPIESGDEAEELARRVAEFKVQLGTTLESVEDSGLEPTSTCGVRSLQQTIAGKDFRSQDLETDRPAQEGDRIVSTIHQDPSTSLNVKGTLKEDNSNRNRNRHSNSNERIHSKLEHRSRNSPPEVPNRKRPRHHEITGQMGTSRALTEDLETELSKSEPFAVGGGGGGGGGEAVNVGRLKSPPITVNKETVEDLDRRVLMTRVLGLPGCCLEKGLLRHQTLNGWTPTDEMLLEECRRRLSTRSMVFRSVLIKLLMDNPIRDVQEINQLLLRLLDLDTEYHQTALRPDDSQTEEPCIAHVNVPKPKGETAIPAKMPPTNNCVKNESVRWSFDELLCSSSSAKSTAPAGISHTFTVDGEDRPSECVVKPRIDSELVSHLPNVDCDDRVNKVKENVQWNRLETDADTTGGKGSCTLHDSKSTNQQLLSTLEAELGIECNADESISPSSQQGVDSMDEMSSTLGSFRSMSLSSFSMSNDRSSGRSSNTNPSTQHSSSSTPSTGESSSSNPSTLSSSKDDSGLTASSKKHSRIRGAGPLSPVTEDRPATQGTMEGKEVTVVGDVVDSNDGLTATQTGDDTSLVSNLTGSVMVSVDSDSARKVEEMTLCDKDGNSGKYTGTVFGSGVAAPHGKGKMVYDRGLVYEGDWKDGKWEDYGKLTFADESYYAGEFARGVFWGRGLRQWPDSSRYEGEWKFGKRSGSGCFRSCCGDETEGIWVDDQVEGKGRVTFVNGSHYEGMFVGGVPQGDCRYRDVYGKEHDGVWVSNKEMADESRYDGLCLEGKAHGFGKCLYRNGDVYTGEYHKGVKHGRGRFTTAEGCHFEGIFMNDSSAVNGKYMDREGRELDDVQLSNHVLPDGARYEGSWKDGGVNGCGESSYVNGDFYEGEFREGLKHGLGCLTYADGSQHIGMFVAGHAHGLSTYIDVSGTEHKGVWVCNRGLSDGSLYNGQWQNGRANGFGKWQYPDGVTYIGKFCHKVRYEEGWRFD